MNLHGSWLAGTSPLRENRIKGAYAWFSAWTGKERGMRERQVSAFCKNLVRRMDSDGNGELSGRELYNALHHRELGLRDIAARLVVKHDSEWYGGSGHHRWNVYFSHYDSLRIDYAKQWLDDCEWMSKVEAFKDGKPVWHFHPVMFCSAIDDSETDEMDLKWLNVPKGQLTFNAEGNDIGTSIYFSRRPHVPDNRGVVIGASGVTFGRGLDFGQQKEAYINSLLIEMEKDAKPLSDSLKKWLLGSVGKKGALALKYCNDIDSYVPKGEQFLSRKQQHFLFKAVYNNFYAVTKRILSNRVNINGVRVTADLDSFELNVQDVLVDLIFRGDNSVITRKYFMKDLNESKISFKKNISNIRWVNVFGVPKERFNSRKGYL